MKNKRGLTLTELLISLALISIVVVTVTQLAVFGLNAHNRTMNEFDVQTRIRVISQRINTTVRDSSGVFLLHRENANHLTPEWNYIMLSPQKDKMVHYVWDSSSSSHRIEELFPSHDGITLDFQLHLPGTSGVSRLLDLNFSIIGHGETRTIQTEIEAKNALQVVDRSYLLEANTLAYRKDARLDEVSNSQAAVTMVLDVSGSMSKTLANTNANDNSTNPLYHSRLKLMKNEALRLIEELSELPNVYVGITPFSSTANSSHRMMNIKQELETDPGIRRIVNSLSAGGGTNTGDGIRRAYYNIHEFNEAHQDKTNKNFMIILVDGVTTFGSIHEVVTDHSISYSSHQGASISVNGKPYTYSHTTGFWIWTTYHYKYSGPIYNNYVMGDGGIANEEGTENNFYSAGRYFGYGNNLDPHGTEYVNKVGEMIQSYKEGTNEEIKTYVIGFSAISGDFGSLRDIALATTGNTVYYEAGSSEALEEIFSAIQRDISDALWHIGGPN